jgi:hypothetical protein
VPEIGGRKNETEVEWLAERFEEHRPHLRTVP